MRWLNGAPALAYGDYPQTGSIGRDSRAPGLADSDWAFGFEVPCDHGQASLVANSKDSPEKDPKPIHVVDQSYTVADSALRLERSTHEVPVLIKGPILFVQCQLRQNDEPQ